VVDTLGIVDSDYRWVAKWEVVPAAVLPDLVDIPYPVEGVAPVDSEQAVEGVVLVDSEQAAHQEEFVVFAVFAVIVDIDKASFGKAHVDLGSCRVRAYLARLVGELAA
jgi:hypothetical protein